MVKESQNGRRAVSDTTGGTGSTASTKATPGTKRTRSPRPTASTAEPAPQATDRIGVRAQVLFATIPEWVLYHRELSDGAVRLYGVLNRYANQNAEAWPSRKTLATKMARPNGKPASTSSVDRWLAELIAVGALAREARTRDTDGGSTSNLYILFSIPQGGVPTDDDPPSPQMTTPPPHVWGPKKESHKNESHMNEDRPAASPQGQSPRTDSQGGSSPSVTRASATKPPTNHAQTQRNDARSAASTKAFPWQCTRHQDAENDAPCYGCKRARVSWEASEKLRVVQAVQEHSQRERCPKPGHENQYADACPNCRADHLAGEA